VRYGYGMTLDEAYEARQTTEDVFTAEGDAGVIAHISFERQQAFLDGPNVCRWVALDELTRSQARR
jgi:hypothetical protein